MNQRENDDLRPEYPVELIRSGIRGKYAKQFKEGSNVVVIDPDLSDAFPNSEPSTRRCGTTSPAKSGLPLNPPLQPTANPLRGLSAAELGRYALR